jgi:hypothetical protein
MRIGTIRSTNLLGWLFGEERRLNQGDLERPSPGTQLELMHAAPLLTFAVINKF